MKRTTAILSATLLTTGALATAPSAFAQGAAAAQPKAAQAAQPAKGFSDQQLQNFASASQQIASISQTYTQRLQGAGSDEGKAQKVREEANDKMVKAVESAGLKVDEFNKIGQAIQQDPQLLKRVQAMVQPQQ